MSKVTYFTSRQKVLEVLGTQTPVGFTDVDLSTFVPSGTTAVIAKAEIEVANPGAPGNYAVMQIRKDAAQGVCAQVNIPDASAAAWLNSDDCIIPVDTSRKFQRNLSGVSPTGALTVNVRIYLLGYLT